MRARTGRWYQLRPTLSRPAGLYRVVEEHSDHIVVANKRGDRFTSSRTQFESSCTAPAKAPLNARPHDHLPFYPRGMLWAFGYKVGRNGLRPDERRSILQQLLETPAESLPKVNTPAYRREWGEANSYQRLRKTLACLHAFARNQELKVAPSEEAISDWRSDADWLQHEYRTLIPSLEDLLRELKDLASNGTD